MNMTMLAVICTAYIIVVGRMLIMRAGILYDETSRMRACKEGAAPYKNGAVRRSLPRWASVTAYCLGLFAWGGAAGVVLSVVLQWYWSMW